MKRFHHIGLPWSDQSAPMPGESFATATKTWVTNPAHHPQKIEWLRYAADSPVNEALRVAPHICYEVDNLEAFLSDSETIIEPFEVGEPPFGRAVFIEQDGIAVEYLEIYPGRVWFDDDIE